MAPKITEDGMMVGAVVVVSLQTPKERIWGLMLALNPAGVSMKAIDLNAFDDFIRQVKEANPDSIGLPMVFYPMHRVERIALDEERAGVPSLAQTFERQAGMKLEEYLDSL